MTIVPSYKNQPSSEKGKSQKPDASGPPLTDLNSARKKEEIKEPESLYKSGSSAGVKLKRSNLLSAQETRSDEKADTALRPQTLTEYIGQSRLKAMLQMSIAAAKSRG